MGETEAGTQDRARRPRCTEWAEWEISELRAGVGAGQNVIGRVAWDDQCDPAARAGRVARLLVLLLQPTRPASSTQYQLLAILGRGDNFDCRVEP